MSTNETENMGFGEACINVLVLYQKFYDMPWFYDLEREKLVVNKKLKTRWKMPLWHTCYFGVLLAFTYCVHREYKVLRLHQQGQPIQLEEIITYFIGMAITLQALVTAYTVERSPFWQVYTMRELLELGGCKYTGLPSSERLPDLQEMIGYGIAISFVTFPLIVFAGAFVFDFDPINEFFKGMVPVLLHNLLAASVYSYITFFAAMACASFILLILTCCHTFELKTELNYKLSLGLNPERRPGALEKFAWFLMTPVLKCLEIRFPTLMRSLQNRSGKDKEPVAVVLAPVKLQGTTRRNLTLTERFSRMRNMHNALLTVMTPSNANVDILIPTMSGVGIALCVIINSSIIAFYQHFSVLKIFLCSFIVINVSIHWLIIFFCRHAAIPAETTSDTILFWKARLFKRLERRQVRAMHTFGFAFGPFFGIRKMTALDMMSTVMDYTTNILLS